MSISILKQDIKNKKLNNLYLFYGDEDYLIKHYLNNIEDIVLGGDQTGLNKIVLEENIEIRKIIEACETMPFFCEKKLVLVKGSGLFKSKRGIRGKQNNKDELLDYMQNIPLHVCLVFWEREIDKRLKTVDAIKKKGLVVQFPYQNQNELVRWVMKVVGSNNKEIDTKTASFLIEICEPGMNDILNELDKVLMFLGDRPKVTVDDIEKLCTKSIKSRVFDLTDAISERNVDTALKLLNDMIILKEPLTKILFLIAKQLRQILGMKLLNDEGFGMKEACAKLGITPYIGSKIFKQANGFSPDRLKAAIQEALELDISIKTGKINDRAALELLICNLAAQ
jgi:DNA polymerase-3 subunit delta